MIEKGSIEELGNDRVRKHYRVAEFEVNFKHVFALQPPPPQKKKSNYNTVKVHE